MRSKLLLAALAAAAGTLVALPASAMSFFGGPYGNNPLGFNLSVNGLLRAEVAGRVDAPQNWNNQGGNPFDRQTLPRQAYVPPGLLMPADQAPYHWSSIPVPNTPETNDANILVSRGNVVPWQPNNLNYAVLRSDVNLTFRFHHGFKLTAKLRALYQPDVYNSFDAASVRNIQGGIATGPHVGPQALYGTTPDFYDYIVDGDTSPVPLQWTGQNYMFYFPALVLEWSHGGLDVRVGNQQIAWGQSIFLRVFDVPDGLDYRQHLLLDRGLEEFSQIRVPAPGIRVQYQLTNNILFDGYVQKFQPSYLPNANTPYNLIPSQFAIRDNYYTGGFSRWTTLSGGFRLKGDYGNWGWELGFVRRFNPLGSFSWAMTGVNRPLQGGPGSVGATVNALYALKQPMGTGTCTTTYNQGRCRRYASEGGALAHAPFYPAPGGVYTWQEWFYTANKTKVNAISALNTAITEYPGAPDSYASPVTNIADARAELSTFFSAAGGSLRGAAQREYFQENDYMLGLNFVINSSNDFLNQTIVNIEAQYTPKLHPLLTANFTSTYPSVSNYKVSIDFDKWYRLFKHLPSTFMVLEGFTSQRVDLVNRSLKGYGGTATKPATGISGNANYVVFGFMQPFKNKIFTLEFASLYDPRGGVLLQPGLLWAPGHGFQVFGAFNYINGNLYGNPGENLLSSLAFAQEAFIRLTYNFSL